MRIRPATPLPDHDWLRLRRALWPDGDDGTHLGEMAVFVAQPGRFGQFIACADTGEAIGFAEVSIRSDYVNGTQSSPVAFLEGIYVDSHARRQGVAAALVEKVRAWALERGCSELASDTEVANTLSQQVHARLGFTETERVVYFSLAL